MKRSFILCCLMIGWLHSLSQTCLGIKPNNDTTLDCGANCFNLRVRIPDLRSTDNYVVQAIPYRPYPFITFSPSLVLPCATNDDKFYDASALPFPFCFFGQEYSQLTIGTNGIISFDMSNTLRCNHWSLRTGSTAATAVPIPAIGPGTCPTGSCPTPSLTHLYPAASIMGVYHDLDIDKTSANKKTEFRIEGTAPCRRAIISFNEVPHFSCNSLTSTHQIVLYEGTGIIDVFVKDKPICTTWNNGLAIIGIQNQDRTIGIAPPARNNGVWGTSGMNEAWRFLPSGNTSFFRSVQVFKGNTLIATGDTSSAGNGELWANFNNICLTDDSTELRIVANYATCAGALTTVEAADTIMVRRPFPVQVDVVAASCQTGGNGIVTVTAPIGAGIEYSTDDVNWTSGNVFNLTSGSHTIYVRNNNTGRKSCRRVTVPLIEAVKATVTTTPALCYASTDGTIRVVTTAGTAPFRYSADGGVTYQDSSVFKRGAGTYSIRVRDVNNCFKDTTVTIGRPDSISISKQVNAAFCSGTADGQIIVTAVGGTPNYQYSIDDSAYQIGNVLQTKVGSFTAYVKDANGCKASIGNIIVPLNDTMRLAPLPDSNLCQGSSMVIVPNTNATSFNWSPATGLSSTTARNPVASPVDTITYFLDARLGTLCSRKDTFTIRILRPPIPDAGKDTTICYETTARLNGSAIRGNSFAWTPVTGLSDPTRPDPFVNILTSTTYTLAVTDPYNCNFVRTDTVRVNVRPKVKAFAGQDTTATIGTPVQLFGCCMNLYQWSPSSLFRDPTARDPIGNFPAGNNQVIMLTTTPEGCSGRDTVIVKGYIGPDYYVPSGFSPGNRDGRNDVFRPIPVGIEETFYFSVFNRYGQMVYTTKTFMEGWDGTYMGKLQPEGAYIWMVKGRSIEGKIVEKKGTVMLLRN